MNKEYILSMIAGLSLAAVNELVRRDNDIGCVTTTVESISELSKIRTSIINDNVTRLLGDKKVSIHNSSFLHKFTSNDISNGTYGNIPLNIATVLENELNLVKNTISPEIAELGSEIKTAVGVGANETILDTYDIKYVAKTTLGNMILAENNATGGATFRHLLTDGITFNAAFPLVEDMSVLREYIKSTNALLNDQVDIFLSKKDDSYWVELYNNVFGSIRPTNTNITRLSADRIRTHEDAMFIYLFTRVFSKAIPFTVIGIKSEILLAIETLHRFISINVRNSLTELNDAIDSNEVIISKTDKSLLLSAPAMSKHGISVDVVIASTMHGSMTSKGLVEMKDVLETEFLNMHNLYHIAQDKAVHSKYVKAYMTVLDDMFGEDTVYTKGRRELYDEVDAMTDEELARTNRVLATMLCRYKYNESNAKLIYDKSEEYAVMFDSNKVDMGALSEYVALELVIKYLQTHLIITE